MTGDIDLQIVDISNPSSPKLHNSKLVLNGRGSTEDVTSVKPGATEEILIHQNRVYATHSLGGIEVFDIESPGKVQYISLIETLGVPNFISISNNTLYISTTKGVKITYLNSVAPATVTSRVQVPEKFGVIDIGKNHAFITAGGYLNIYDINKLEAINLISQLNLTTNPIQLMFYNDHVFLTGKEKTLQIINVSDTKSPELIAEYDENGIGISLDIQNDLLALIDENLGLLLFNIAEPGNPELLSMTPIDRPLNDIKIVGKYIYISSYEELLIYDIADPETLIRPEETLDLYITNITPFRPTLLETWNDQLYVVNNAGLNTFNISNPLNPVSRTNYKNNLHATNIEVSDDILYITLETGGLMAYELSLKDPPLLLTTAITASHNFDFSTHGNQVFLTDDFAGLTVFPKAIQSEWKKSNSGLFDVSIPNHLPDGIYHTIANVSGFSAGVYFLRTREFLNQLRISSTPVFDKKSNLLFIPQVDIDSDVSYQAYLSAEQDENSNLTFRLQSASAINSQYKTFSTFSAEQALLKLPKVQVVDENMTIQQYSADLGLIMNSNPMEFYIKQLNDELPHIGFGEVRTETIIQ